jgi:subtilase family serine protease
MISRRRQFRTLTAVASAGILCLAGLATTIGAQAAPAAGSGRATLAGTRPAWAVASRMVAPAGPAATVTARVYLAGRDPAGLTAYAAGVSDPASPLYRKFLTSGQELRRFGPSAAQVSAVRGWLASAGLRVTAVTRHYLTATGPAAVAQAAFGTRLARFRAPGGTVAVAPARSLSVPDSVRDDVLTVTGLDTAPALLQPALAVQPAGDGTPAQAPSAFYTARPCSGYYGQRSATSTPKAYGKHVPWAICGYTPQQLRSAYGLTARSPDGKGITIAVVDAYASPTIAADVRTYVRAEKFPGLSSGLRQQPAAKFDDQSECDQPSWSEEEALDIEAAHTMAPAAKIEYAGAADCTFGPLMDALTSIVDTQSADIITNSWTGPEDSLDPATRTAFDQIFEQGATEGIGFDFASGDCGYNDPRTGCGASELSSEPRANYPSSSPWVTAVGGTSLAIGPRGGYQWETGWGDMVVPQHGASWKRTPPGRYPADFAYGAGGGTSVYYRQPSWQAGIVPARVASRSPRGQAGPARMREVPDVALDADPATGFQYGLTVRRKGGKTGFLLSRIGGTSLSSPLFAGLEADAAQQAGGKLGFVNPALYRLAKTGAFHDVTDSPLGPGHRVALARNEWAHSATGTGAIETSLYTLGTDGTGTEALHATTGYDDVTGLGSPAAPFIRDLAGQVTGPVGQVSGRSSRDRGAARR